MIINTATKTSYNEVEISEKELQNLVISNFKLLFPELNILSSEFKLKGDVRLLGVSGRIDILALNEKLLQIVIFELKKHQSNHIIVQAIEYSDFIEDNLELIILKLDIDNQLKKKIIKANLKPKIILIANKFLHPSIKKINSLSNEIVLYEYKYFHSGLLEITNFNEINVLEKSPLYNNKFHDLNSFDAFKKTKELIENGMLQEEKYYKIESGNLYVNGTIIYNTYRDLALNKNEVPVSKTNFINSLKANPNFVKMHSAMRFKYNNTSVYEFKFH